MANKQRSGVSYGVVAILVIIAFAIGAGAGIGGYIYVTGGSGEPSRSVDDVIADIQSDDDADTQTVEETPVESNESADADTATETGATNEEAAGDVVAYSIIGEQSEVSFTLDEDLRGERVTVVGTTSEVGGTFNVNMADPAASTIDTIVVNARTLATDSDMRDRATRSRILNSAQDEFEFIIFEPKELSNFSAESVAVGDTITFDITGDLTVKGTTQSVTFNASVTVDSETQISGSATTQVLRSDYGLVIPDVPSVANVTDEVYLAINFVATVGTES